MPQDPVRPAFGAACGFRQAAQRGMAQDFLGSRGAGIGFRADDQIGGGQNHQLERHAARGVAAELLRDMGEPRMGDDVVAQRSGAQRVTVGVVERRARPVPRPRKAAKIRLEPADQSLCRVLTAQERPDLPYPLRHIRKAVGDIDLCDLDPEARAAIETVVGSDQTPARTRSGWSRNISSAPPWFTGTADASSCMAEVSGSCAMSPDRDQLPLAREHQRELVGAEVHRDHRARADRHRRGVAAASARPAAVSAQMARSEPRAKANVERPVRRPVARGAV